MTSERKIKSLTREGRDRDLLCMTHYDSWEASQELGVGRQCLKNWWNIGKGPERKLIGGRIWYSKDEVDKFVAAKKLEMDNKKAVKRKAYLDARAEVAARSVKFHRVSVYVPVEYAKSVKASKMFTTRLEELALELCVYSFGKKK